MTYLIPTYLIEHWLRILIVLIGAVLIIGIWFIPESPEVIQGRTLNNQIYDTTHSTTDCKILQEKQIEIFNLGGRSGEFFGLYLDNMADYVKEKMAILGC